MVDYLVIREDEYEFIFDTKSEPSYIEIYYSYNLNVNYVDIDIDLDSGNSNYDTLKFIICMNHITLLDYSQQALPITRAISIRDNRAILSFGNTFFMASTSKPHVESLISMMTSGSSFHIDK